MPSPKKNVAYEFFISLVDSTDTGAFKANPTIAVGDFKVSTDGGAFANLATLPVVTPAGSIGVKINLSAAEMNGDKIQVQVIDAAGDEWDDVLIFIDATAVNVEDIVRATTPANTLNVNVSNEASSDLLDKADGVEPASAGTERTVREALRLILASAVGKLSGAATTTVKIRDTNDSKDRIDATVDANGNRTVVTLTDT